MTYPDNVILKQEAKIQQTSYLEIYVEQMCQILKKKIQIPAHMVLHKLEEILLILLDQYSIDFFLFFAPSKGLDSLTFKTLVESNLMKNIKLEEFALRCHKSVSSFKGILKKYAICPQVNI